MSQNVTKGKKLPPWYPWIEEHLVRTRTETTVVLWAILIITAFAIMAKSNTFRTLWAIYVISP